jgi:hypothetical protein
MPDGMVLISKDEGDDVVPHFQLDILHVDIPVRSPDKELFFPPVDRILGLPEKIRSPGLDFCKDDKIVFHADDVNFSFSIPPVTLEDTIPLFLEVFRSQVLSGPAGFIMFCHRKL